MKALIYKNGISLGERETPKILNPRDAIVKVHLSSICTSDLHIIKGFIPRAKNDIILGHEFVGEVIAVGSQVKNITVGDRVSANCETLCGECFFCQHGWVNNCEKGGWELGCRIDGCQAEFVRVPYADNGLTKLPENVSYENALFVGDILASGYFGAEMCEIKKGDKIAVIGAGPVGLCAMMCAKILGADKIIAIDIDETKLHIARMQGLADITLSPEEAKEIHDADGVIECAGTNDSFQLAWQIARPNAIVGIVAMYEENQILPLPQMYGKNLTFKTGGVDANKCDLLVKLIEQKKISTDFLITHTFPFDKILDAYKLFEAKPQGCLKVAIKY